MLKKRLKGTKLSTYVDSTIEYTQSVNEKGFTVLEGKFSIGSCLHLHPKWADKQLENREKLEEKIKDYIYREKIFPEIYEAISLSEKKDIEKFYDILKILGYKKWENDNGELIDLEKGEKINK